MSTEVYKYYNPNPDAKPGKRWHRDDCVIRAFACALRKTWTEVYREICETGLKMFDIPFGLRVITAYAKQKGMTKVSLPDYMTIRDFAEAFDQGSISATQGHIWVA